LRLRSILEQSQERVDTFKTSQDLCRSICRDFSTQSSLFTTATLGTKRNWPLFKSCRYSEVAVRIDCTCKPLIEAFENINRLAEIKTDY